MHLNKTLIERRFAASFERYHHLADTQREICRRLVALLADAMADAGSPNPEKVVEIGAGTGFLTELLAERFPDAHFLINDLSPQAEPWLRAQLQGKSHEFRWGDAEKIALPPEIDLLASASTLQWFADPEAFLKKCAHTTSPGGWLAIATFGADNFRELRALSPQRLDYPTIDQLPDYQIITRDQYHETLHFDTPRKLLEHIRAIGVNALHEARVTPRKLRDFGATTLTYHPVLLVARKKV